ncbi:MAG: M13 family metallopeptidase [Actinomycetota bacterium]
MSEKSGIFQGNFKPSIRPQDDMYRHVNGAWLDKAEIPSDRAADGAFYFLRDESEKNVRVIIEELAKSGGKPGSNAQKIADLYNDFMDESRVEDLDIAPIAGDLESAQSISGLEDFTKALGRFEGRGLGGFFNGWVTADASDPSTNIAYFYQGGLSLPDEAYYREEKHGELRGKLTTHIERMFELAGIGDGPAHARRVMELESEIASHHWDTVRSRDAVLTFNKKNFAEVQGLIGQFDLKLWAESAGMPGHVLETVVIAQPDFVENLGKMLERFETAKWRSWLTWHLLSSAAPYLSSRFVNENFAFYGTTLTGIPVLKERWKRGVALVESALGEAVGEFYVEKHFPPAAKTRMSQLVSNLIEAYRISINDLTWMGEETKKKALEKLGKFTPKIGYPDKWRDYSKLEIKRGDLLGNLARVSKFRGDYEYNKVGKPVDKSEWLMTPQTVNAYYQPLMNEIVFPAAILQPPFFDLDADDAVNYGGIGAVIGHEIGHGFDDQGSRYDGDGNLKNWWSDADRKEFEKRTSSLISQYNALAPEEVPDTNVNGALTIGENIGDLGGATIAYKAYKIALAGKAAPVIDGLTGDQRFFVGYAQVWRGKIRSEAMKVRLATDPHSPGEFRCNQILKNLPQFHNAFQVKPGDALYMAPEEQVAIW